MWWLCLWLCAREVEMQQVRNCEIGQVVHLGHRNKYLPNLFLLALIHSHVVPT